MPQKEEDVYDDAISNINNVEEFVKRFRVEGHDVIVFAHRPLNMIGGGLISGVDGSYLQGKEFAWIHTEVVIVTAKGKVFYRGFHGDDDDGNPQGFIADPHWNRFLSNGEYRFSRMSWVLNKGTSGVDLVNRVGSSSPFSRPENYDVRKCNCQTFGNSVKLESIRSSDLLGWKIRN